MTSSSAMSPTRLVRNLEAPGDDVVAILRRKTGAERLRIAACMYSAARDMLLSHLRHEHPEWEERRLIREAARRLSHGTS